MSDTTTQAPYDPEPGELALARFEEVADQLRDPHAILSNALLRIHQADDVQAEMDAVTGDEYDEVPGAGAFGQAYARLSDRQQFLTNSAEALTEIARLAAHLADRERAAHSLDDFYADDLTEEDEADGADIFTEAVPAPIRYAPQPVTNTRFKADINPGSVGTYVGSVGGAEWLYVHGHGFFDIMHADESSQGEVNLYTLEGRIVSATPDHILGITDGGMGVTLPRALVSESPEDRR
jgi:hypothetical protein